MDTQITKKYFYKLGGFANPNLYRKNGPSYTYWKKG